MAFTPNVHVQVFSSPYNTNQTRRVNRFFLCCRGDGADECNTQHWCTTAALVSVGSSYNNYLIKYNIVSLTQPKNAKNNKIQLSANREYFYGFFRIYNIMYSFEENYNNVCVCVCVIIFTPIRIHLNARSTTPRQGGDAKIDLPFTFWFSLLFLLLFSIHILYRVSRWCREKRITIFYFLHYVKQITTCPSNCGGTPWKIYITYYRDTCNRSLYIHRVILYIGIVHRDNPE